MFKKIIPLLLLLSSFPSHAGFFDSAPELKCGNDNAVSAIKEWIVNEALSELQSTYLELPSQFYNLPQNQYEQQIRAIALKTDDVLTQSQRTELNKRSCTARFSAAIPASTLELVKALPDNLRLITIGDGKTLNNHIVWKDINYDIRFADNEKDIIIIPNESNYLIAKSVFNMAVFSVAKDALLENSKREELRDIEDEYNENDRTLNAKWSALPDSIRSVMKKEQQIWATNKAKTCGSLSDARSEMLPVTQRINIFACQNRLTISRIDYLAGKPMP